MLTPTESDLRKQFLSDVLAHPKPAARDKSDTEEYREVWELEQRREAAAMRGERR